MSSPPWRKISSTRQGTASLYSAADLNAIMDLLNGVDTGKPVAINNNWNFVRSPTGVTFVIADNSVTTTMLQDNAVTGAKIAAGTIVDSDISATAAIAKSKLAALNITSADIVDGSIADADVSATAAVAYSKLALANSIVNADINSAAAIAKSKLANLAIVDADVAAGAAIAKSKLAALNIANADVATAAAIAYSKLALGNSIVNSDINSAASIAKSKIGPLGIVDTDISGVSYVALHHLKESGLAAASNAAITATGLLGGGSPALGTGTFVTDTTGGHYITKVSTTANNVIGFYTIAVTARALNPRLRGAMGFGTLGATGDARMYFGLSTVAPNSSVDTVMANTTMGVIIGARTTDANIQVFNNDGTGAQVVTDTGVAKSGSNLAHLEIIANDAAPNFQCYVNGVLKATLTTRIPDSTSGLIPHSWVVAATTNSVTQNWGFYQLAHTTTRTDWSGVV